jgi:mRNA interferase RelE/StbE
VEITLSKRAVKALSALDASTRARMVAGINKLPSGDVKKLQGYTAAFRLRVGDYRILFEMSATEIRVSDILPRGSAYK